MCAAREKVATELILGFEWPRRSIILEVFSYTNFSRRALEFTLNLNTVGFGLDALAAQSNGRG
jgi:hypothetical protein